MRYAVVMNGGGRCPVIRIDTNQGIYGLGEVRDGANWRYALFLKSRIMGMNPCSVEMIFKKIKQFGFHGRQAGGVCAVEMALWDLAGKAYNDIFGKIFMHFEKRIRIAERNFTIENELVMQGEVACERVFNGEAHRERPPAEGKFLREFLKMVLQFSVGHFRHVPNGGVADDVPRFKSFP